MFNVLLCSVVVSFASLETSKVLGKRPSAFRLSILAFKNALSLLPALSPSTFSLSPF